MPGKKMKAAQGLPKQILVDDIDIECPSDNPDCDDGLALTFPSLQVCGTVSPPNEPVTVKFTNLDLGGSRDEAAYVWDEIFSVQVEEGLQAGCHQILAFHTNNPGVNDAIKVKLRMTTFEPFTPITIKMPLHNPLCADRELIIQAPFQVIGTVNPPKEPVTVHIIRLFTNIKVFDESAAVHGPTFVANVPDLVRGAYRVKAFQTDHPERRAQIVVCIGRPPRPSIHIMKPILASAECSVPIDLEVAGKVVPPYEPVTVEVNDLQGCVVTRMAAKVIKKEFSASVKLKPKTKYQLVAFHTRSPNVRDEKWIQT